MRNDPNIQNDGHKELSSVASFTQNLMTNPIFIIVAAKESAIVSIDVQLIHSNSDFISSITLQ